MQMDWMPQGWPADFKWSDDAISVIERIDDAFADCAQPSQFTDRDHCSECREHDDELRADPRNRLTRANLGHMGWDPVTFANDEAIAYLFPALARHAMAPASAADHDWYGVQLLFHLSYHGEDNRLLAHFDERQKTAVRDMLLWLMGGRSAEIRSYAAEDDLLAAMQLWDHAAS